MPYAPLAFSASYRQPLSRSHMSFRQPKKVVGLKPKLAIMLYAMDWAEPGSGGVDVTKTTPSLPPPAVVPGLAAATWAGWASLGLATTVSVRAAVVIATSCARSDSSVAMVWLPGTTPIAWTALKALDPGANSLPPTATPATAITAKMVTGKTRPKRRIRPRLRLMLRAPVRCRDKAILSSGHARAMLAAVSANPGFSGCGRSRHSRHATGRAAPDLVRRLAAARKYRWRITMPESSPMRAALRQVRSNALNVRFHGGRRLPAGCHLRFVCSFGCYDARNCRQTRMRTWG